MIQTHLVCLSFYVPLHKRGRFGMCPFVMSSVLTTKCCLYLLPSIFYIYYFIFFVRFAEVQKMNNESINDCNFEPSMFGFLCVAVVVKLLAQEKSLEELTMNSEQKKRSKFFSSWLKFCHLVEQKIPKLWQIFHASCFKRDIKPGIHWWDSVLKVICAVSEAERLGQCTACSLQSI